MGNISSGAKKGKKNHSSLLSHPSVPISYAPPVAVASSSSAYQPAAEVLQNPSATIQQESRAENPSYNTSQPVPQILPASIATDQLSVYQRGSVFQDPRATIPAQELQNNPSVYMPSGDPYNTAEIFIAPESRAANPSYYLAGNVDQDPRATISAEELQNNPSVYMPSSDPYNTAEIFIAPESRAANSSYYLPGNVDQDPRATIPEQALQDNPSVYMPSSDPYNTAEIFITPESRATNPSYYTSQLTPAAPAPYVPNFYSDTNVPPLDIAQISKGSVYIPDFSSNTSAPEMAEQLKPEVKQLQQKEDVYVPDFSSNARAREIAEQLQQEGDVYLPDFFAGNGQARQQEEPGISEEDNVQNYPQDNSTFQDTPTFEDTTVDDYGSGFWFNSGVAS